MNSVTLVGRLTDYPKLEYFKNEDAKEGEHKYSNRCFCVMVLAVPRTNAKEGEEAEIYRVTVYDGTAENCHQYLWKGSLVCIRGRLQKRRYKEGNRWRTLTDIIGEEVDFLYTPPRKKRNNLREQMAYIKALTWAEKAGILPQV